MLNGPGGRQTLKTLWIFYSCCGFLLLLLAVFVPAGVILEHTPTCYSVKQYGRECFMCGSTRSFIQAGSGNFREAAKMNRLALVIFIITAVNSAALMYYLLINHKPQNQ
jgi:hypothetical protein